MHVLSQLCLQWGHDGKLLADKYLCEQLMSTSEYHSLLLEVLNVGALGKELGHIMYSVTCHWYLAG